MVIGIVAKNGMLLMDAYQKLRETGMSAEEAILGAGERRLRPILMTALATIAGMVPLSLALGAGIASMVLSLVVTPAIHYYIERK